MPLEPVFTDKAAPPAAPYSQAVKAGGFVYVSGQIPLRADGSKVEGDIKVQAQQCFDNIKAIVEAAGSEVTKIVKLNIFTTDIKYFAAVNEVYVNFFNGHKPARSFTAAKALPLNMEVEIEAIALA